MSQANVLVVSPYKEMIPLLRQVGEQYPEMNIIYKTGNLEQGVEIARKYSGKGIDFIISRGGTARQIAEAVSIPVVHIQTSIYDMIRVVQIARTLPGQFAIVGYASTTVNARALMMILPQKVEVVCIASSQEAEAAILHLRDKGICRIVGDTIAVRTAQRLNMEALIIASGRESIEESFRHVSQFCAQFDHLVDRCHMLENAVRRAPAVSMVLDREGNVLLDGQSGERAVPEKLLAYLRSTRNTPEKISQLRQIDGNTWRVDAWPLPGQENSATLFQVAAVREHPAVASILKKYPLSESVVNPVEPVDNLGRMETVFHQAARLSASNLPVALIAPQGSPFLPLLRTLFQRTNGQQTMLCFDFAQCNSCAFEKLLEDDSSYLYGNGQCIAFYSPEALEDTQLKRLADYAEHTLLHRRNRVVYVLHTRTPSEDLRHYLRRAGCVELNVPALNERIEDIPVLVGVYINMLNVQLGCNVTSVEPEGMRLIMRAAWPDNNQQLIHILRQLMLSAQDHVISAQAIEDALAVTEGTRKSTCATELVHMGTLEEIDRYVVNTLLHEGRMNRSELAAHLGVSRSKLWRMLNSEK